MTAKEDKKMNVQRSYFKKTLILLIAVIMVIAYMPNGTWGVSQLRGLTSL